MTFLNALERIPKQMEQYKTENAKLEKDLPTLREVAGGTWKKEEELKQLKSEVAALDRKIQLTLPSSGQQTLQTFDEEKITYIAKNSHSSSSTNENTRKFAKENHKVYQPVYSSGNKEQSKGVKL